MRSTATPAGVRSATAAGTAAGSGTRAGTISAAGAAGGRLWIDWTACDGRGWCIDLLPELLDRDPAGYPLARGGGAGAPSTREIPISPKLVDHARRAAQSCPRLALRMLSDVPATDHQPGRAR